MQSSLALVGDFVPVPLPPVCSGRGAGIVKKFSGEAKAANYFRASDETAEAVIRNLYQKAHEDLSKLSTKDRCECDKALLNAGNEAIWYGNSALEILYGSGVDGNSVLGPVLGTLASVATVGVLPIMLSSIYATDIK
jgi:hypothetical protein